MALVSFAQKLKLIEEVGRLSDSSLVATHHGKFLPAFVKDVFVFGNGPVSKASQTRAEAIAKKRMHMLCGSTVLLSQAHYQIYDLMCFLCVLSALRSL